MYYANESGAYVVDSSGACKSLGVSVVERSVTTTEIDSITVSEGKEMDLPSGAVPASLAEIVARFGVTRKNPLVPQSDPEPETMSAGAIDPDGHTREELLQIAEDKGVQVPSKATKAEIAALIDSAE